MITKTLSGKLSGLSPKILFLFFLCLNASLAVGQVRDAFKLRGPGGLQGDPNTCIFSLHGDFTMIANVNIWASSGADNQTRVNNSTNMVRVDLDGISTTTSSSMAELKLYSTCSKIVYAGLYWTARTSNSVTDAAKKTVKIKGPGATAYTTLTSPMYSRTPGDANQYNCFTDVTQYVKQQGVGQYWVADIALTEGSEDNTGNYGGWGMVVIYEDAQLPMRNIAMFDGYAYVASGDLKYSIPVSGFKSVQTGPVKVKLGFMAGEGDAGYSGDWCQMRKATAAGNVNTDADWIHLENPSTAFASQNFWRSRVTNDAGAARNPNYTNNLGFDAFVMTADNTNNQFIGNNQTSSAIRYGTNLDQYIIVNMTMAVDAYEPDPQVTNQVANGSTYTDQRTVGPGDTMTYKLEVTNQGNEAVLNTKIEIPIPYNATYVANSIVTSFDASLTGATVTYDPAGQKIVVNLGTLPVPPANNLNKIFASITYKLKATTDCYYLKNTNACLRNIALQGTITGTGSITGVAVNKKTISGFQTGTCSQSPLTTPTTVSIVVPASYTACNGYVNVTPNLRICPGSATTIPSTTIRGLLTLPSNITYVFNSASNGSGTVYNDNNPFPATNGTYYAVPVNTIDSSCSGSIPFTVTILTVNTPPNTPGTSFTYCPSALPATLVATPTSVDYSVFWYTQPTGGNSVGSVTIAANTTPGIYTYYVAQGYDASCQSSRVPITVKVNPAPTAPSLNGPTILCGGLEDSYSIISPSGAFKYEWALDNAPVGIAFKNGITAGTTITLTEAASASGTFTVKVRAQDTTTSCYSDYRTLSVTVNPKPADLSTISGPTAVCENSTGNFFTLNNAGVSVNYEWAYSGTGYSWADGANTGQTVELQLATGAASGNVSVRAKTTAGCYSNPSTLAITVNPRPTAPASATADTICTGQHAFVKIVNSGTLKYQVYSGVTPIGALTTGNNGVLSIDLGTYPAAGNFSYTVKSFNDQCYSSGQTNVSFTVVNIPTVPVTSSGITSCYMAQPVVQVINAVPGIVYKVYDNAGLAGSPLTTVTANASPFNITIADNPTANKIYYITASNGICASQAATVPVSVRAQIMMPALTAANICVGQKASITVSNPPTGGGAFDTVINRYKAYSDAAGTNEIVLTGFEQTGPNELVLHTNITNGTTVYVRLVGFGCNGPLSPVTIQTAPRPAPSVVTPVTQCLNTRALITIHNTTKGNYYRVFDNAAGAGTPIRDIQSLQSGDQIISLPQATVWTAGTIFYVQEAVRDDSNTVDLCLSPLSAVTMQSGTPAAPSFSFTPAYTCSGDTAIVTINNTLSNHTYNIYDSPSGSTIIKSVTPLAYISQYPVSINLPSNFVSTGGSITYWMDMLENGSTCNSDRTPINIILSTPPTPVLENANLIVCRGSIPVIVVDNAKKDVSYAVYNSNTDTLVSGPITANVDGSLSIPISNAGIPNGQSLSLYVQAQAPSAQNSCTSLRRDFVLNDGEPVMPVMQNFTVCHGAPINISIPNTINGYSYLIYDASNTLVGSGTGNGGIINVLVNDPNIPNPGYPSANTVLNYTVKVQGTTCLSQTSVPFTIRYHRTAVAGQYFMAKDTSVCEHSDAVVEINIIAPSGVDLTNLSLDIKWYNNSDLTDLLYTQHITTLTGNMNRTFSGLAAGTYVYYVTISGSGICENKPGDAAIARITIKPHADAQDISALDALICSGEPLTLEIDLENPAITNPIFNWYSDINHTMQVASNTSTFSPNPNLTADTTYYITVHNDTYCENPPNDDERINVAVNQLVVPPSVTIAGNATAICSGYDVNLNITPSGSVSGYELWENNAPLSPANYTVNMTGNTITIFAPSVGNHTYTVVSQLYSNGITCESDPTAASASVSVIVNNVVAPPTITINEAGVCKGESTIINVAYTGPQPSGYILYDDGEVVDTSLYSVSSNMQTITFDHSIVALHSHTLVSLVTTNGITCQSQLSAPAISGLYARPTASISNTGNNTLCQGAQGQLTLNFTGTPPFTYSVQAVDINNQVTNIVQDVTTNSTTVTLTPTLSVKTFYSVSALSDANCSALPGELPEAVSIDVYSELQPGDLMSVVEICNNTDPGGLNITFAFGGDTSNYQYSWQQDLGSGFADIGVNTADYDPGTITTGSYTFQRTVTDGCQTKTTQTTITVHSNLIGGSLIADTGICNLTSPGALSLTLPTDGNTNQYAYMWHRFDSISPVTGTIVSLSEDYTPEALSAGTYRYKRIINDACQTDSNEVTITVYSNITPGSLVSTTSVCVNNSPGELNHTLASGGNTANYNYSWQLWNGSTFINLSPAVTTAEYTPAGTAFDQVDSYLYQRLLTDGCQIESAVVQINVFSDLSGGSLIADTGICNGTSPGNLNRLPASLCGSGSNINYQWLTLDATSNLIPLGVTTVDYNPGNLTPGTYGYQRVADDGAGNMDSSPFVMIIVWEDLQAGSLVADTSICNGTSPGNLDRSLPIGGNTAKYAYSWQIFNGTSFEDVNPVATTSSYNPGFLTTGTYQYRRTITDSCQTKYDTTIVTVRSSLDAGSLIDTSICLNSSPGELSITLPSGGNTSNYTYSWQLWNGTTLADITPLVLTSGHNPGNLDTLKTYLFQRTISDGCQTLTAQGTIAIKPLPDASIYTDSEICEGESIFLKFNLIGTAPWTITFIYGNSATQIIETFNALPYQYPIIPQENTTTYTIKKVVDGTGCSVDY